jgi:hypothetical protein
MLTILHPELYQAVLNYPIGVMAAFDPDGGSPLLIVKATKEYLLAAKTSESFKVYVCPAELNAQRTEALVFAFFDDESEPLTIRTPLVDDSESRCLISTLLSEKASIHLFDEHGREFLVYEGEVDIPEVTRKRLSDIALFSGSFVEVQKMQHLVKTWFSLRIPQDEEEAITVKLVRNVYGDSIAIQDLRHPLHQHHGSKGFSISMLEREEPGSFQEEDIIKCLAMCFPQSQIYHGPLRTTDKEEICDVMVVTESHLLIIQAKDSPNIERIVRQKMSRKRSTASSAFKKAIGQVRGAQTYLRVGNGELRYILEGQESCIDIAEKKILAVVVLKEVFEHDGEEYARAINALMIERRIPCYVISYGLLFELCYRVRDAEKFIRFSEEVIDYITIEKDLPIINFHS